MSENLRLKDQPASERPRERLVELGPDALSHAELIAILLRTGMKVAQLVFQKLDKPAERPYGHPDLKSKYQNQAGATASKYNLNAP